MLHSPANRFDVLVQRAVLRVLLVLVGLEEDHGLLVTIGAHLEVLLGHFRAGRVLQILCEEQHMGNSCRHVEGSSLTLLELAFVAEISYELIRAMVQLVELVPLLQIHAPPRIALDAAHALAQLTETQQQVKRH